MGALGLVVVLAIASVCHAATPQLRFAWKEMSYPWETSEARETAIKKGRYIPENNLPLGLDRWRNKMFVTVPKWKGGVASTLNYVDLDGAQDQTLKPYPSFENNFISDSATEIPTNSSLVSVFRVFVDACDRLWMVDNGVAAHFGDRHRVTGPSIVVFDLKTDKLILRHRFESSVLTESSFFANIIVDVNKNTCDDAYAYIPDLAGFGLIVYSLKQDDSWRITHNYFHLDPLGGSFNVSGIEFQWSDGVLGLALSDPMEDGYRTLYFHALSSNTEFTVSTELLRNYKNFSKNEAFHAFKLLGDRGAGCQSASSFYDPKTQVLFYTQVSRDGVACWNTNKPYTVENNPLFLSDPEIYSFPSDLKVDEEGTLWFMSDKLPQFFYKSMDPNTVNYRIFSMETTEAVQGTTCA